MCCRWERMRNIHVKCISLFRGPFIDIFFVTKLILIFTEQDNGFINQELLLVVFLGLYIVGTWKSASSCRTKSMFFCTECLLCNLSSKSLIFINISLNRFTLQICECNVVKWNMFAQIQISIFFNLKTKYFTNEDKQMRLQ